MESTIFMLTAYAKSDREDLSAAEKQQMKAVVASLKKEYEE
jgi:hypothetical protein